MSTTSPSLTEDLQLASSMARQAGELIRSRWGTSVRVEHKGEIDLVSEVDLAAEALILNALRVARPQDDVLAEESASGDQMIGALSPTSGRVWCVDPLDGTTNFSHGFPHFCTSIALLVGGRAQVGVIYDPLRDWLFSAIMGGGAWLNGSQLHVSHQGELRRALLATGFPYDRHVSDHDNLAQTNRVLKRCRGLRRAGAAALDLAFVAAGWLDGYWEYKLKPWDVAAGSLIAQEAGATLTDELGGHAWLHRGAIIATGSPELHHELKSNLDEAWHGH